MQVAVRINEIQSVNQTSHFEALMGQFKLRRRILRRFRLLVFDQPVAENGTVSFSASLKTQNFPLLIPSQKSNASLLMV